MRQIAFLIVVAVFSLMLISAAIYYILRARRATRDAWTSILARLKQIDRDKVAVVALDLIEDREASQQLDPELIFTMIGGLDGLETINQNCDVLVDLATYVQRWYPDVLQVAEELRLNAREIKWHIGRLRGALETGHIREQFPVYAQRAVATYYLMTRSLLVLYEGVHLPELTELQRAI